MGDDLRLPDIELYRGVTEIDGFDDIDAVFRDREFHIETHSASRPSTPFLEGTVLTIDGVDHSHARRVQGPLFRRDALEFYETEIVLASIDRCLSDLRESRGSDPVVHTDLIHVCREMLCDMAVRLIGLGDLSDATRRERFMQLSELLSQGIAISWHNGPDRAERLADSLAAKQEFWAEWVEPKLTEQRAARARNADPASSDEALDLLTLLVAQEAEEGKTDDEMILRNCLMYASGSINTTTHGVVHTFNLLKDWFAEHPDRWEERHDPNFLHAAAAEGLRLHPPIPAPLRKAGHDKTLPSGATVESEEILALYLTKANHDPGVFGECPREMDPDRVTTNGAKPYGTSFGGGRHICIGRPLALPNRTDDEHTTLGSMVRMLDALYTAGTEPDPTVPRPTPANDRGDYSTYPVILTAL